MNNIIPNKKLIFSLLISFISITTSHSAYAQIFEAPQNPLSVNWRQIKTSGFTIIYPTELETEGQRMAGTIRYIFPLVGGSLGVKKTTYPILLQNQGVVANGFVQLAPKKSEFYATPPQSFDSQDWLNNLAVHELRHVAQFTRLTGGRSNLFPEYAYFAWMGASIPLWFFEGDAVSNETSLTNVGRGRQPSWIMPYRTALLSGKNYSYSKSDFGSQKDVEMGYYQFGYLIVSRLRQAAGKFIIDSLLTDLKDHKFRLYPLAKSMRKFTGKTAREWYEYNNAKMKKDWEEQARLTPSKTYPSLTRQASYETNYFLPVPLPDGKILALKQSKSEPSAFFLVDKNKDEQRLLGIGQQEQPWFSYANGKIVWDEIRFDPRFTQRSYSVVCSYDLQTKKVKKLSTRSRIFSPTLSSDGAKIAAVQIDLANKVRLIVMDAQTGKIIRYVPNPDNLLIQTPSFNKSGSTIAYISVSEAGKALWTVDQNNRKKKLIEETQQQLGRPVYINDKIAFNAHYSGIDNVYDIDVITKKISALSASKFGAFNVSKIPGTDSILFNNFDLYGYGIAKAKIEQMKTGKNNFVFFGAAAAKQENTGDVFSSIPDTTFTSTPYKKLGHLFNFHSVYPVVANDRQAGIRLQSNNLLNTFDSFAEVDYMSDLKRFQYNAGVSLKALYPIISLNYTNEPVRTFYETGNGVQQGDFRQNYYHLQAEVPINLSAQNHNFGFTFDAGTSLTKRYDGENMPVNYLKSIDLPVESSFTFSHTINSSERDIAPAWAQVFRITYLTKPLGQQELNGKLFATENFLYFPGLAKNHSFLVNFNYQQTSGVWIYSNAITTVYGYDNIMAKSKLTNTLLLNYRFPIAFPDAELGPLAYITNIRGGVFCDYENFGSETNIGQPKTYGFELHSNMNVFRYSPVLDLGTRFVFVNQEYHHSPILQLTVNYTF
ncbi:hypothetical protein [Pedobacter sp. L105]|uniref:TolB family protein n=1 Tax=Pedobacter sp. L105 TaxID=1641871 RepID=UPI00131C95BF|nr:hypothetical protein [Pedobacter sp. L105]